MQDAVNTEADDERIVLRLEVDVAGAILGRLKDDRVDEPDERRVRDPVVDLEIVCLLVDDLQLDDIAQPGAHAEGFRGSREAAELGDDVLLRGDAQLEWVAACQPKLVSPMDVLRVGDRNAE